MKKLLIFLLLHSALLGQGPLPPTNLQAQTSTGRTVGTVVVDGVLYPRTSAGLNAAIVAAGTNGKVIATPGAYAITAQILVNASNIEVTGYGAVLTCTVAADCFRLDSTTPPTNTYSNIVLKGFTLKPGAGSGGTGVGDGFSGIHDNGNASTIEDIKFVPNSTYRFDYGIRVDNDEAATIRGLDMNPVGIGGAVITATSTFVGSSIYNPPDFETNAAVGWISNSNISPQCGGNGIDWQGGNLLHIDDTIIQGIAQFSVRTNTSKVLSTNVYMEFGNCTNPFGNIGKTGYIVQGGSLTQVGGLDSGTAPVFVQNGTTGSTLYQYWVVPILTGATKGNPLGAGYLTNGNATLGGANTVTVVWPKVGTATLYDILRMSPTPGSDQSAPTGVGNYAVTTGYTQATCGTNVCSFTDNVPTASLASYTVANAQYYPKLDLWGGVHIFTVTATGSETNSYDIASFIGPANIGPDVSVGNVFNHTNRITYQPGAMWNVNGVGGANQPYTAIQDSSFNLSTSLFGGNYNPAFLLPNQGGAFSTMPANIKGLLNLGNLNPGFTNSDLVTLIDQGYQATLAKMSHRPTSRDDDTAICADNSGNGLCLRAPTSLSNYIGVNPNNTSWKERLTSTLKTYSVPILITSIAVGSLPAASGVTGQMRTVSDSTTVTTAGQTCVGGGAVTALAFSNGVSWKCF